MIAQTIMLLTLMAAALANDYRSYTTDIQAGLVQLVSSTLPLTNNQSYPILFSNVTDSTDYSYVFSLATLFQSLSRGIGGTSFRYGVMLTQYQKLTPSSMRIWVEYWTATNTIAALKVRYVIIDNSFPYLHAIYISNYSYPQVTYGSSPLNQSVGLRFTTSNTDKIFPYFAGFDIRLNGGLFPPDYSLSFEVVVEPESSSSVRVIFKSSGSTVSTNFVRRYAVFVLFYHRPQFKAAHNYQGFQFGVVNAIVNSANANTVRLSMPASSTPISNLNNFYVDGISAYANPAASSQIFFNNYHSGFGFYKGGISQTYNSSTLIFLSTPNCTNSVWNISINQCQCPSTDQFYRMDIGTCEQCNMTFGIGCTACLPTQCLVCPFPYAISNSSCVLDCSVQCTNCSLSAYSPIGYECLGCPSGYYLQNYRECNTRCGDGTFVVETEECDDGNQYDRDGCSSLCQIQADFNCTNTNLSQSACVLTRFQMKAEAVVKSEQDNSFTLTLSVEPVDMIFYQTSNWSAVFDAQVNGLTVKNVVFDADKNWLRVTFSYSQDLHGTSVNIGAAIPSAGSHFSVLTAASISLPSEVENNMKLIVYTDSSYQLASIVKYCSYMVAILSVLVFFLGYFGAKIIAIECVAVTQVAALLLMTLEDLGPTFYSLRYLDVSLGITSILSDGYRYESSSLPAHLKPIVPNRDCISSFNIFLGVAICPLFVGGILAILALTACKENKNIGQAWRYSFGTFTYYGLLFLAYGIIAQLVINFRYIELDSSSSIGIAVGCTFFVGLTISTILSNIYPKHYGSFKSKFYRFESGQYFYTFSSIERLLTACFIVCLSPGYLSISFPLLFFCIKIIFIIIKRPYIEGKWKRPLFNKILSTLICSCYLAASFMDTKGQIYQMLPFAILVILMITNASSLILAAKNIYSECQEKSELKDKIYKLEENQIVTEPMTFQEAQKTLMLQFQKKMMPTSFPMDAFKWRPVQHEQADISSWRWKNYPHLYSLDLPFEQKRLPKKRGQFENRHVRQEQAKEQLEGLYDQI